MRGEPCPPSPRRTDRAPTLVYPTAPADGGVGEEKETTTTSSSLTILLCPISLILLLAKQSREAILSEYIVIRGRPSARHVSLKASVVRGRPRLKAIVSTCSRTVLVAVRDHRTKPPWHEAILLALREAGHGRLRPGKTRGHHRHLFEAGPSHRAWPSQEARLERGRPSCLLRASCLPCARPASLKATVVRGRPRPEAIVDACSRPASGPRSAPGPMRCCPCSRVRRRTARAGGGGPIRTHARRRPCEGQTARGRLQGQCAFVLIVRHERLEGRRAIVLALGIEVKPRAQGREGRVMPALKIVVVRGRPRPEAIAHAYSKPALAILRGRRTPVYCLGHCWDRRRGH